MTGNRVVSRAVLLRRFGRPRDERLVFTNGVFDLLHVGHVASLEAARALGDRLVVGINSDASTRRLKGPERPYQPEADRARLVAALRCVDAVTLFDEDTPGALIEALLPDVLVKGADYEGREVVGAEAVRAAGGEVRLVEMVGGRSTTDIAARIRGTG
ncbi:MAG TPA: D-glycero-beta-D-manno-heptose 1-phosphate adenylyltransferase [Gemmatimonadota bacterium]|nr:D-glycero-beta-D-manno-heptose 1-phosphate adenylyltransferase [Gemmatimonadota bacterium]